jgi:hypothetical protein
MGQNPGFYHQTFPYQKLRAFNKNKRTRAGRRATQLNSFAGVAMVASLLVVLDGCTGDISLDKGVVVSRRYTYISCPGRTWLAARLAATRRRATSNAMA